MSNQSISVFGYDDCTNMALLGYATCNPKGTYRVRRPFTTTVSFTILYLVRCRAQSDTTSMQFSPVSRLKSTEKTHYSVQSLRNITVLQSRYRPQKQVKMAVKAAYQPRSAQYTTHTISYTVTHDDTVSVTIQYTVIPDLDVLDL